MGRGIFQMTKQLEHSWVKEIFNEQEMKQYAEFEAKMKANATAKSKEQFEKEWQQLVAQVNESLTSDPSSETGILMGKKFMAWVNQLYGKEYAHLRTKKFEKGF